MAASCQHAALLSTIQSVECRSGFRKSPLWPFPFRPATHFRLKVVEGEGEWGRVVKIAVVGDVQGLKAAIWIVDEDGETIDLRENVDVNATYVFVSTPAGRRVFCRLWIDECAACEEREKAEEESAALNAQVEELKAQLAEEREQAEARRQELQAQLEAMADEKQKFAAISKENAELKSQAVDSAEFNAVLDAKCRELQEELAERSSAMNREVKKLTSRMVAESGCSLASSAHAQTRTEQLKQKRAQLAAIKAEKERLRQANQQNDENDENNEQPEQQLAFLLQRVAIGQQSATMQTDQIGEQAAPSSSKPSDSSGESAEVRPVDDSSDEWERV